MGDSTCIPVAGARSSQLFDRFSRAARVDFGKRRIRPGGAAHRSGPPTLDAVRIALVSHGLPPERRTGVETHAAALARALACVGLEVLAIAPASDPTRAAGSLVERARDVPGGGTVRELRWAVPRAPRSVHERDDPPGLASALDELWRRERPAVVHVESAFGLGLAPFRTAHAAGLPVLASAHDYTAVCHRATLVRPDLERCSTVGDPRACARCDAATEVLDGIERLGDYQLGVRAGELEPAERDALARALGADDAARLPARRDFARARRAAWNACARVLVPTAFLREHLVTGGVAPERLTPFEFGVDSRELVALEPPRRAPGEPLRVAYLGGLSKHKGVHLLIDAARAAGGEVELVVAGWSTDEPYRRELLRRSEGARTIRFTGAYDRAELPRILAGAHVVAVPSTWVENAPFVVREAFAARRPVLASDLGALRESVHDDVDGRWVEPTAAAWSRALLELARDPAALGRLVGGIRPPRTIDDEAEELAGLYDALASGAARDERLPTSVRPFAARLAALDGEGPARVARRALAVLERGGGAADRDEEPAVAAAALVELERVAADLRAATRELEWLREQLAAADERDAWRTQSERAHGEAVAALRAELEHERGRSAAFAAESAWWRARAEAAEAEADWRAGTSAALERELQALAEHERWLRGEVARLAGAAGAGPGELPPSELPELLARLAARLGGPR